MPVLDASVDQARAVAAAGAALASGAVIGVPTDTVYGLAASRPEAVGQLFELKGRPPSVPLAVLVSDLTQALELTGGLGGGALELAKRFWPGALTLVVPLGDGDHPVASSVAARATGAGPGVRATLGVRCPDNGVARALCRHAGPLVTTSANLHGRPELTTAGAVDTTFGSGVALVLDGGTCAGKPSTVADCSGPLPTCLREGALAWDAVLAAVAANGEAASEAARGTARGTARRAAGRPRRPGSGR